MSGTIVVSNRGPLTFRAGADGALVPVPAGGGLASSLHRILAGSGTTWASVTMGAADREAVAQGLMHEDGLDLRPGRHRRRHLPPGLRRRGQHHALVLPPPSLRPAAPPPLRPPLAGGLGGLPGLQPGHGRRRGGTGRRGRRRLRAGLPLLAARADAGRGAPGPAHGALPAHALRRARHARPCCPTTWWPSCSTAWPATRPAASTATSGRPGSRPVTPRPGAPRPPTFVAPLGPDAGVLEEEAAGAGLRRGGGRTAGRGGRPPHHRPDRPHGALEEHRAGDARLRGAPDRVPRMARPGGARGAGLSQPAGSGRVSRLRRRRRAHGGAHQPRLGGPPTGPPSFSRSRTTGPARSPS